MVNGSLSMLHPYGVYLATDGYYRLWPLRISAYFRWLGNPLKSVTKSSLAILKSDIFFRF